MMRIPFTVTVVSLAAPPAWARSYDVSLSRLRETPADRRSTVVLHVRWGSSSPCTSVQHDGSQWFGVHAADEQSQHSSNPSLLDRPSRLGLMDLDGGPTLDT